MESIGQPLPFATGHRANPSTQHEMLKSGGLCVRALPDNELSYHAADYCPDRPPP
jgi:hypothetical protein